MRKVAIIPARSGSKGLKDKNIISLCGKPLIAYSIEAAIKSKTFEQVIVTTDSELYGQISRQYGAEVMYRGEELSNDNASTFMVLEDLLHRLDVPIDYFVLLQPTSPMRTEKHIKEAIELFESQIDYFDFLASVQKAEHGKILVNPIGEDGSLKYFDSDYTNYKRQLYNDYIPNGAIYIGKPDKYLERGHFYGDKSLAYIMNAFDSVDIDNPIDLELAKICMNKKKSGEI